jgi:predicted nucleic acid-binding protein
MKTAKTILVDSSIWIDYFRSGVGKQYDMIEYYIDTNSIVICGIIELEILQGAQKKERNLIEDLFSALPYIETSRNDFLRAAELLGSLRKQGITIPLSDGIIAAQCLRRDIFLMSTDKHFDYIERLKRF